LGKGGLPQTRYQVSYFDGDGRRKRKDFKLARQAKSFVESLTEHRKAGVSFSEASGTESFEDATEVFIKACEIGRDGKPPLEPATLKDYRWRLERRVFPVIGKLKVGKLTQDDFERLRDTLLASGITRGSAKQTLLYAKSVMNHAVARRVIAANPGTIVKVHRDARREAVARQGIPIHTKQEMTAILGAARALSQTTGRLAWMRNVWERFEPMLHVLVYCGLRMSELRGLPRDALARDGKTIRIYQRADMGGVLGPPKSSHGARIIHITPGLAERLQAWMTANPGDVSGLMFPTASGLPISHPNIAQRMWRRVQEKAAVTILHPHAARHFYASMMIDQGMNLKALQESLGHHDPMFTLKAYGHLFRDPADIAMRQEMAARMQSVLEDED
jgi:integrase